MAGPMRLIVLTGVFLFCAQAFSQAQAPATPSSAVRASSTRSPTNTPRPTPYDVGAPKTIDVADESVNVTAITPEQALQLVQWKEERAATQRNLILSWVTLGVAAVVVVFAGLRWRAFEKSTREQMLASYRERLFSDSPSACIATAMSLRKYPEEAIWLVMRWAEEHKKQAAAEQNRTDPQQVKEAIQDVLINMRHRASPARPRLRRCQTLSKSRLFTWLVYPVFWERGPRLDGLRISIQIGPIQLPGAWMADGDFRGVGLQGARLRIADLRRALLRNADLRAAHLSGANLKKARLWQANLHGADLHNAYLYKAGLQGTDLQDADLRGAILKGAELYHRKLEQPHRPYTNLTGAKLAGACFQKAKLEKVKIETAYLSYAASQQAILDPSQRDCVDKWDQNHGNEAPWLQKKSWKFWWQKTLNRDSARDQEIRIVSEYIEKLNNEEKGKL